MSHKVIVTVIAGDKRYIYLVRNLLRHGVVVKTLGFLNNAELGTAIRESSLYQALEGAQVIILPMAGLDKNNYVTSSLTGESWYISDEVLEVCANNVLLITGIISPALQSIVAKRNITVRALTDDDAFAIYNSIPTAEGAILMAMENSEITLHGSTSFTLGYGRCGKTLALMLKGIGARSVAVARKNADLARIQSDGLRPLAFEQLMAHISQADFIFNTVPHLVLTKPVLHKMKPSAVIVDIASDPGGTDFVSAQELAVKAELAPSLPGKIAPRTSGEMMAKVVIDIISTVVM